MAAGRWNEIEAVMIDGVLTTTTTTKITSSTVAGNDFRVHVIYCFLSFFRSFILSHEQSRICICRSFNEISGQRHISSRQNTLFAPTLKLQCKTIITVV